MLVGPAQNGADHSAHVAVVGTGPAGLALALALGDAGLDVLVLESGLEAPTAFAASLAAAADAPGNHARLEDLGSRRLGGASWTWGGRCVAYDPVDFEPRPGAEAPGWPVSHAEMMRTAAPAAAFLGIGPPDFGPPPVDLPGFPASVLERWSGLPQLMKRHGNALRDSTAVRVLLGTACTGLAINGQGLVERLDGKTAGGRPVAIRADHVVLAAGGIENARLLLRAFDELPASAKPAWLGRGYMGHLAGSIADVVLREEAAEALDYFLTGDGCYARRRLVIDSETARSQGLMNIGFHIDNPPLRNPDHRSAGLSAAALALSAPGLRQALLSKTMSEVLVGPKLTRAEAAGHLANIARAPASAIAFGAKAIWGRFSRPVRPGVIAKSRAGRYALKFVAEQSASYASHVSLSDERDALGLPRVRIAPHFPGQDVESVLKAHESLDASLQAGGLGRLVYHAPPARRAAAILAQAGDGYHQIGLARMGRDIATSVTDENARVHGARNLFVAGSAVFPTSGQANPTFLIVCQALRLASYLIAARG